MNDLKFTVPQTLAKAIDRRLGIVFGYAIVSKINGEDYYDTQGDHIPDDALLEAAIEYVESHGSAGKEMHTGNIVGKVPFIFPLTEEIAKSLNINPPACGLLIGFKPDSAEVLEKFASGEYTGFSIGGRRIEDENV